MARKGSDVKLSAFLLGKFSLGDESDATSPTNAKHSKRIREPMLKPKNDGGDAVRSGARKRGKRGNAQQERGGVLIRVQPTAPSSGHSG